MNSKKDNSSFWLIFFLTIIFGSYFFIEFEKELKLKDIEENYSVAKGVIVDFRQVRGTKNSPEKFMIDIEFQAKGMKYLVSKQLRRNWIYTKKSNIKAERGDLLKIAFSKLNPNHSEVISNLPFLPDSIENNLDKIEGNLKWEMLELYNNSIDTFGIVVDLNCTENNQFAKFEFMGQDKHTHSAFFPIGCGQDDFVYYKIYGLPRVNIGDSMKIRFSKRVPKIYECLPSTLKKVKL
jgi:hypothetical protein